MDQEGDIHTDGAMAGAPAAHGAGAEEKIGHFFDGTFIQITGAG
jgi:hypothetical protein